MSKRALEDAKCATEFNISLPPIINGLSGNTYATSLTSSFSNDSMVIESNTEYPQIIIDKPYQCYS